MVRQLSSKSSLDVLKQDAKRWLKSLRHADPAARQRLTQAWPAAPDTPSLRDVQHALAREYGFTDWIALSAAIEDLALDRKSHAERVAAVLLHGWDGSATLARRLIARYPAIRRDSIFTAAACGEVDEVRRQLDRDPALATALGGPREWTALACVTYSRLDAEHAVTIARMLLDAGADPNVRFDDGWGSPFTALTGAIGLGEGAKPTHPQADDLVALLIERGADPFDTQALYNSSIVRDDIHWTATLWQYCEAQQRTAIWSEVEGPALNGPHKVGTLNYLLGNAVGQNHLVRARWLLEHGARADTIHSYTGQPVHTVARLSGFAAMTTLLEEHGARAESLTGEHALLAAVMSGDESTARALVTAQPRLVAHPMLLLKAAELGQAHAVSALLSLGARVDAVDHDGISPLHRAVQSGSLAVVEQLLTAGADVDLRERKWQGTPLSWARVLGRPHVAARLLPISRDVRALAAAGESARLATVLAAEPELARHRLARHEAPTPLFCLPEDDEAATVITQLLLSHGADPTVTNDAGRTAEQMARFRGLDEAADLMASVGRR